jgi:hypothetical protein
MASGNRIFNEFEADGEVRIGSGYPFQRHFIHHKSQMI